MSARTIKDKLTSMSFCLINLLDRFHKIMGYIPVCQACVIPLLILIHTEQRN